MLKGAILMRSNIYLINSLNIVLMEAVSGIAFRGLLLADLEFNPGMVEPQGG